MHLCTNKWPCLAVFRTIILRISLQFYLVFLYLSFSVALFLFVFNVNFFVSVIFFFLFKIVKITNPASRYICKIGQDLLDTQHLVLGEQSIIVCLLNSYTVYPRNVVNSIKQLTARNLQDFLDIQFA